MTRVGEQRRIKGFGGTTRRPAPFYLEDRRRAGDNTKKDIYKAGWRELELPVSG